MASASGRFELKMPSKETEFRERLDAAWDEVSAEQRSSELVKLGASGKYLQIVVRLLFANLSFHQSIKHHLAESFI